jgi:hypothetical protein
MPRWIRFGGAVTVAMAVATAAACFAGACGGGDPGSRPIGDGGPPDGGDGGVERPPGVNCPVAAAGEKRGLGACCSEAANCTDGVCWNGFCSRTCTAAADCGGPVASPSPLPAGTTMKCASNALGDPFSYCLPGSLTPCAPAGGGSCPAGESCALGLDPAATQAGPGAYLGLCLTKLVAGPYRPAGSTCDESAGPYECESQGGYLGNGCFERRCTRACRGNADCPIGMACGPPPFAPRLGGATSRAPSPGICLGLVCGDVHGDAGLALGQVTEQGADKRCPTGELCLPSVATGAAGDTLHLACQPPGPGPVAYAMTCTTDPGSTTRCADDALCVTRGANRFCSSLCRVDADCPAGTDSVCLDDFAQVALPYGSAARLGMCTPRGLLPGRACTGERDCAGGVQQACKPAGARTQLRLCQDAAGSRTVGQECDRPSDCVSGACYDRDLQDPTGGNRTLCGGYCLKNSDCGAQQICQRVVGNNNATVDDPTDDVVRGTCTPLRGVARQGACRTDADCGLQTAVDEIGGDACDVALGTCFRRDARVGSSCARRAECPLGAYCRIGDPRFEGGACLLSGCDPAATSGADACPAGSICEQRDPDVPLWACYEACPAAGGACARAAEGYICLAARPGEPPAICASEGGT